MRKLLDGLADIHNYLDDIHNYLDDVIEHTSAWSSHVSRLRTFLERVRVANLALKPSKCFVGFADLVFLGHKVGQTGLSPSEDLVTKIKQASHLPQRNNFVRFWDWLGTIVPLFPTLRLSQSHNRSHEEGCSECSCLVGHP